MIDELFSDAGARGLALRLRPGDDPVQTLARVAWGVLSEPGDGVAGALVAELGAEEALRAGLAGTRAPLRRDAVPSAHRALAEGRARWHPRAEPEAVRAAMRDALAVSADLLFPGDEAWPAAVDDLDVHAPLLLWVRGDPQTLCRRPAVSIVGARAATAYGGMVAAELAGDLAASGTLIVSGGAYGIDGAAHRAALGVGGATVAFLAGGIDRLYPAGHLSLFESIVSRGALASEVPCGAAPTRWRFLARNRLIAALGMATVVVEAGWRSGTLNTAGHASALSRPLGAVPGPVTSAASAGCHRLLREYDAQCVTTAAEVRELLGDPGGAGEETPMPPDGEGIRVLDALSTRTVSSVGEVAVRSGLSEHAVTVRLGLLSVEGLVEGVDGGWRRTRA